jgi:alanine racemase
MQALGAEPRRRFLAGLCGLPTWIASHRASAAPVLSESNFGLTYRQASRSNAWIEIDAMGFNRNLAALRSLIGRQAAICAVMKADAYGHGISLLLPSAIVAGVDCVGLTSNEEARICRAMHFRGRILRLRTAIPEEVEDAWAWHVEELVGNLSHARRLSAIALRKGRSLAVHLALNSGGMSRNGVELGVDWGRDDARQILALPGLKIVGIMSHYPVEEEGDMRAGLRRFVDEAQWVMDTGSLKRTGVQWHIANSFATLNVPEARLDMVRVGGLLYGDTDPRFPQFRPIMTLKSRVAAVNHYPFGDTVCYDRTFRLDRDSWLANIPLGYSDGYRRVFSHANVPAIDRNQAFVLIRGRRLPVVGRVTMNTLMVDVTDWRDEIGIGDEVVLYGRQGSDEITLDNLASIAATIGADLYVLWSSAVPRVLQPQ